MKRIIISILLLSLITPVLINAQVASRQSTGERIYNLVGTVQAINATEKSFELKLGGLAYRIKGFFASLYSLFNKKYILPVYKVISDENTVFQKKSTSGVVTGTFSDLSVGLRVQVKGILSSSSGDQYRGVILAKNVFILTPFSVTTSSLAPECQNDNDCTWCGLNCLAKSRLPKPPICPQVMPPEGFTCKCDNGSCKKIASVKNGGEKPGETIGAECTLACYKVGNEVKGWAWRCLDPVKEEWHWQLRASGAVNLVKLDPLCDGCRAECLHKGTPEEGYYDSCTGKLIIAGCQPPFIKPHNGGPRPIIKP